MSVPVNPGDVFMVGSKHRRVIALCGFDRKRIAYSVGSDVNRSCLLSTFVRWLRSSGAVRVRVRNK